MKKLLALVALLSGITAQAAPTKRILVVLSSEQKITLRNGFAHPTGFFLSELMVPLRELIKAGYTPVFATPKGNAPFMDKISDGPGWFASPQEYANVRAAFDRLEGIQNPMTLRAALTCGASAFDAIIVPGGHAPMEDLLKDRDLGLLLKQFHAALKPTALICHGPIALLSTLDNPEAYLKAVTELSEAQANADHKRVSQIQSKLASLTKNWIYRDYAMTAFSTKEEQQEEPAGADNVLGGLVKFYPDEALAFAGAKVTVKAVKWQSHAVSDRELITGQNPVSDKEFAARLLQLLRR